MSIFKYISTRRLKRFWDKGIVPIKNEVAELNTNLAALQELRFFSTTPYFNGDHTQTQAIAANGSVYIFCPGVNNAIFQTASSGTGQYFVLKKVGNYRITLHAEIPNNNNGLLTLDLKDANNTSIYKSVRGYSRTPMEILVYNSAATRSYLLALTSATAGTLYSDARYTWIEVEYLG